MAAEARFDPDESHQGQQPSRSAPLLTGSTPREPDCAPGIEGGQLSRRRGRSPGAEPEMPSRPLGAADAGARAG